jgi:alpha/beta superfamily hydrolase
LKEALPVIFISNSFGGSVSYEVAFQLEHIYNVLLFHSIKIASSFHTDEDAGTLYLENNLADAMNWADWTDDKKERSRLLVVEGTSCFLIL